MRAICRLRGRLFAEHLQEAPDESETGSANVIAGTVE